MRSGAAHIVAPHRAPFLIFAEEGRTEAVYELDIARSLPLIPLGRVPTAQTRLESSLVPEHNVNTWSECH